ncbi:MAG TPA: hypothetical protein VGO14_11725 [Solirubrobacteraceae bacterium]|jgi:hypothetical protein|nr:hypothetical protein [Solirubrobacteraceae bacterium]
MDLTTRSRRQKTLLAVAIGALIAGTIVAVIAATGDGGRKGSSATTGAGGQAGQPALNGDLKVAVAYLEVPPAKLLESLRSGRTLAQVADSTPGRSAKGLVDRIVATRKAALAAAVRAGGLKPAQESAALASLRTRVRTRVGRVGGYPSAVGRLSGRPSAAAAAYLGITQAKLRSQLRGGRTLAQLAHATPGRSASGLMAAIVADTKSRLAASVAAGGLTAAREKLLLANLEQRVAAEVRGGKP